VQERVSLDEARAIIATQLAGLRLPVERVDLSEVAGRVLAEPLRAPFTLPRFDNSMVDGYAVRSVDLANVRFKPITLKVIGQQRAGHSSASMKRDLVAGECVEISTGAALASGADAVLMLENVQRSGDEIRAINSVASGDCVRRKGEEFEQNQTVLRTGQRFDAAAIALAASFGFSSVRCYAKPRVVVLASGDELVPHDTGAPLQGSQVFDANRALLNALLLGDGARVYLHPLLPDREEVIESALLQAAGSADLIISTGGASVGAADFMPKLVRKLGSCFFWRIRLKPGMPALFGRIGKTPILVLPGNPVSVLSTYLMLARPALQRLSGFEPKAPLSFSVPLAQPLRKTHLRRDLMRAVVKSVNGELRAFVLHAQGSHRLSSLIGGEFADQPDAHFCLLDIPEAACELEAGSLVRFMPFSGLLG
jgi:molybdopterin molybdotransferase